MLKQTIQAKDKSAHLLAQYIPQKAQNGFLGLRGFNLETLKVADQATQPQLATLKLEFWKSQIQKIFNPEEDLKEPVSKALHDSLFIDKCKFHKKNLLTMVQTQQDRLAKRPLRTIENMEQYGEGVYSQMNYALFDMLCGDTLAEYLASNPDLDSIVTDTLAHVGQANGIAALLRGYQFYVQKHNFLNLPIKELQKHNIAEQQLLDGEHPPKDVVFEVATRANDHILTAKSLIEKFKQETKVKLPYALVLPYMSSVPIEMYLEHLQKCDFDLSAKASGDWKMPWRTWKVYKWA